MAKNERLTDVHRAFIHTAGFSAGIVPMENTEHDMRRALSLLPEEEQKKMKRKFRKLWRKLLRAEKQKPGRTKNQAANTERSVGKGKKIPTKAERNARKRLVATHLEETVVQPMLEKMHKLPKRAATKTDD